MEPRLRPAAGKNDCDTAEFLRVIGAVVTGHCVIASLLPGSSFVSNIPAPPQKKETHFRNEVPGVRKASTRDVSRWHATQPLSTEFRMISHQPPGHTKETTEREEVKLHAESTPYALVYSPIVRSSGATF